MPQLCSKCSRANPADAVYCYFDGFVLGNGDRRGGPVAVGAKPFNSPFVFPTGRTCRSFDELALACQEEWSTASQLLKDGYLESFFGGLGRVDLALAAKEAARFPDLERGLDQLLAKLPSGVLTEPKLRVDPVDVNLGVLDSDKEQNRYLELENQGMRLLYGTVTSDSVWLTLGDAQSGEKHFSFTHETKIPFHVRPNLVRASNKPIEGRLTVESNGGTVTVVIKAQKPVKPFPEGALKGAKTPRQVAEKAQANPKEVAPFFENGDVERWYASNGWTYPVKIPAASGPAAIQQFFEALGVTKPPRVEISDRELNLAGDPGARLPVSLEITTQEKRPVFAHATSNVPWLEVSRAKFGGRTATINMSVPSVPNKPGETLIGEVTVISNGNQRFVVPVRLVIANGTQFDFNAPPPPPPPPKEEIGLVEMEAVKPARPVTDKKPPPPPPVASARRKQAGAPMFLHLVPAGLLALAVLGVFAYDLLNPHQTTSEEGAGGASGLIGPNYNANELLDPKPRLGVEFSENGRFGVVMVGQDDPNNKGQWKKLTYEANGGSNNTIVKIGSSEYKFGIKTPNNVWVRGYQRAREAPAPIKGTSWVSKMEFQNPEDKIRVTQHVQIVPGQTMLLDTLLIWYTVYNYGNVPKNVGVRIMLDTYIGSNDGVPFTVPGHKGFVTTKAEYTGSSIPDYLEAVENPDDPENPGTVARIGLRGLQWSDKVPLLSPDRVRICRFPGNSEIGWEWEMEDLAPPGGKGDSCVVVYWPQEEIEPKHTVHMAMTYGLSKLDISDRLALSAPATVAPGREFVVTAYVYDAKKDEKVTITLPAGVTLTSGNPEITIPEDAKRTQVFWKVKADKEGAVKIGATAGKSSARPITVKIQLKSIFG
jgi:hypothetical protein